MTETASFTVRLTASQLRLLHGSPHFVNTLLTCAQNATKSPVVPGALENGMWLEQHALELDEIRRAILDGAGRLLSLI